MDLVFAIPTSGEKSDFPRKSYARLVTHNAKPISRLVV